MIQVAATDRTGSAIPPVKEVGPERPWDWLSKGWQDILRAPRFSLTYGAAFVAVSLLLTLGLMQADLFFIVPSLAAGFFLVAPMLGIGLYRISENLEEGQPVRFCQALEGWRRNSAQLSAMALVLMLLMLVWMLAAVLIFAVFYDGTVPTDDSFLAYAFLSGENNAFVAAGILVGGVIAAFAYSITVITVPMLMDRPVDAMTAMATSVEAVRKNWAAMTLWAALIVMFVGVGILTYYIGLMVAMPLVGHGTWHAYRDLVPRD